MRPYGDRPAIAGRLRPPLPKETLIKASPQGDSLRACFIVEALQALPAP